MYEAIWFVLSCFKKLYISNTIVIINYIIHQSVIGYAGLCDYVFVIVRRYIWQFSKFSIIIFRDLVE